VVTTNGADTSDALRPDPAIIRRHLDKLFGRCPNEYPGELCELAWSKEGGGAIVNAQSFPTTPKPAKPEPNRII